MVFSLFSVCFVGLFLKPKGRSKRNGAKKGNGEKVAELTYFKYDDRIGCLNCL